MAVDKYQTLYAEAMLHHTAFEGKWRALLCRTQKTFSKKLREWKEEQERKRYSDIADRITSCDMKRAWSKVKELSNPLTTGVNEPMRPSQPLRDSNGKLWTDPAGVQEVMKDHYKELLQDCKPDRVDEPTQPSAEEWNDTAAWRRQLAELVPELGDEASDRPTKEELNEPLRWPEIITAIRAMNGGTAPGVDDLHIDVFKAMIYPEISCLADR
ncbi:hypothetical protein C2E23DRAFT_887424 [Lenzites betulinus]|nr:hypothetical protein C2E23DRAFT_887424 [Lenzites betulinus]